MVTLSNLQNKAIKSATEWFRNTVPGAESRFYLAGYAGSGKSTILPYMIEQAGIDVRDVAFCAPTGKAAKVMTTKLRSIYPGLEPAKTIHSLIYRPGGAKAEQMEAKLEALHKSFEVKLEADPTFRATDEGKRLFADIKLLQTELDAAYRDDEKPYFHLNLESTVREKRLIVVDEASMVGEHIAEDLLKFGVPVLAMGDPFQLPPVGDNPGLTEGEPDFFLHEIHRQAQDNPIIYMSMQIREGVIPRHGSLGGLVHVVRPRNDTYTLDIDYDAQVICGTHKKRWKLTKEIRKAMGYTTTGPCAGEPLIICKNSRKIPELVNGTFVWNLKDTGDLSDGNAVLPLDIEDEDTGLKHKIRSVQALFEEHSHREKNAHTCSSKAMFQAKKNEEHVDFGFVITGHKSQGSQWQNVIVHDESGAFREDNLKWLYTCCTRASEELVLVMP
jgi:exodeoxyribonuclease-5